MVASRKRRVGHLASHASVALLVCFTACRSKEQTSSVKYEIRGFQTKVTEDEYSTSFMHEGSVVAIGDSTTASRPHLIMVEIKHLSGGDPESNRPEIEHSVFIMNHGIGEIRVDGGYRQKRTDYRPAETWLPAKYEVRVIGSSAFTPAASNMARN